ncbi:MAG: pentapeptide repeat-containing protein, partial [Actinomycetes bacterium]
PSSNGGTPVTTYKATASPGSRRCTLVVSTPEVDSCVISGLTNGTAYTASVTATNAAGTSVSSTASASVVAAGVPLAPTGVQAVIVGSNVKVSWTGSVSNGSPLTGFTATSSPGGLTCSSSVTSCQITGFATGVPYVFTVTSTNAIGTSAGTTTSTVTFTALPNAPTGVSAVGGQGSGTVSWVAPVNTGGLSLTGYKVTASPGGQTCLTAGGTSCTVSGLTNGTPYTFTVQAKNSLGYGASSSASSSVTPATVPGTPSNVVAVAGDASASLSWSPPAFNGGSGITGYQISASSGQSMVTQSNATTATFEGLSNGTSYTFRVAAINVVGTGANSTSSVAVIPFFLINGYHVAAGADLANADLSGGNLTGADLTGINLAHATMTSTILTDANLANADLTGVDLRTSTMTRTNLAGADLTNANLAGQALTNLVLSFSTMNGTNLNGASLSGAFLYRVASTGIVGTPTSLPSGYTLVAGYLFGDGVILTGANFAGLNLSSVSLSHVVSGSITGTPASLPTGWSLVAGYLVGASASLRSAVLTGATLSSQDLSNADLTSAKLGGTTLTDTNFTGATLTNATLTGATVTRALFSGVTAIGLSSGGLIGTPTSLPKDWVLIGGYLLGPTANLASAMLNGLNLKSADLFAANLTGAKLIGADLTGVNLGSANLINANLTNAVLIGADLQGAKMKGATVAGAQLDGATLSGVTSSNLVGTPASLPAGWSIVNGSFVHQQ